MGAKESRNAGNPEGIRLSLVVPCYNESRSLEALARRFSESRPLERGFELVLVDNGSTDATGEVMAGVARAHPFVRTVRVEPNIGYGNGIRRGLEEARGEFLAWTHADLQTDPLDAVRAYELALAQAQPDRCLVKGRRGGRPLSDEFFTWGMTAAAALALGGVMEDINAQPNLFHRRWMALLREAPLDFSFDLYVLHTLRRAGLAVVRFPVHFGARAHGQSSWNVGLAAKWKFIRRTAEFIWRLRRRLEEEKRGR